MQQVSIFLDESAVQVCLTHDPCAADGKQPRPDCEQKYLYGVGACVFESQEDQMLLAERLSRIRRRITARNGISTSRRIKKFARDGWHATDDLPEFADPLIEEIDTDGAFKGHVRYVVLEEVVADPSALYEYLFIRLLSNVLTRYADADAVAVVFEGAGKSSGEYQRLVDLAGGTPRVTVSSQGKGNDLLALADYLLYATMRYAARIEQRCPGEGCEVSHRPPAAAEIFFDDVGAHQPVGHVLKDDRWHKLYFAFVRNMSSIVSLRPPGLAA